MLLSRLATFPLLIGLVAVPFCPAPSLLELEATAAIQGELTSTAMPNYMEALDRTQVQRVRTDLQTIAAAIERYRLDHGDYPVAVAVSSPAGPAPGETRYERVFTFPRTNRQGPGNLNYPTPYLTNMPVDPYSGRTGRDLPYAYFIDRETNEWILYSPGPDHDYDIDPLRDFWSPASPSSDALALRTFDRSVDPNDTDGDVVLTNRN